MKLSVYAKKNNIAYRTAHRHWKKGLIKGRQLETGTIVVDDYTPDKGTDTSGVVLYARVSSSENKDNLESQLERLRLFAAAKGFKIVKEIKEIGSGLNDERQKLTKILESDAWAYIIVEHKDRFTRFGFNFIQILLKKLNKNIIVINETNSDKQDLMTDFVSIVTSFCARLYGLRRTQRKTEAIIKALENTQEENNEKEEEQQQQR
jgi:putative resolvase